jgi:hypothetical protein
MTVAVGEAVSDAVRERDPMPAAENDYDRHIEAGIRNLFAHAARRL